MQADDKDWFDLVKERTARWAAPLALIAVAVLSVLHFGNLGHGSLHPWDECLYAIRAKIALTRGMWLDQMPYCFGPLLDPTIQGNGFYSGAFPPVLIWAISICFKIFGMTTLAARLPGALAGMGTIWLMYAWGRAAWDRATGVWAAFILASWFLFISYARRAQFDIPVVFFMTLTGYCGLRYYKDVRMRWLILSGVALGLGLMTKIIICGFAAFAVFLFALTLCLRGELRWPRLIRDHVILNAIGLGIAAPWHVYMFLKYQTSAGNEFWKFFWGYHISKRSSQRLETAGNEWNYYLRLLWTEYKPLWTALIAVAVIWALWRVAVWFFRGIAQRRKISEGLGGAEGVPKHFDWNEEHSLLLPLVWFMFVAGLSQATESKRPVYLFPFTPPMALLVARLLTKAWSGGFPRWGQWGLIGLIAGLTALHRSRKVMTVLMGRKELGGDGLGDSFLHLAQLIGPILLLGLLAAAVLIGLSLLIPRGRRLALAGVLGCVLYIGYQDGLSYNSTTRSMRLFSWAPVEQAIRKQDYNHVYFLSDCFEPDQWYYLDGINRGWREDIRYTQITRPLAAPLSPIPLDPKILTIVQKLIPGERGAENRLTPADLAILLKDYKLVSDGINFQTWRAKDK